MTFVQTQDPRTNPVTLSVGTGAGARVVMPATGLTETTTTMVLTLVGRQTIASLPTALTLTLTGAVALSAGSNLITLETTPDVNLTICT